MLNFFSFLLLFTSASACDWCSQRAKASFFSSPSLLNVGACGYGSLAKELNEGFVAAGSSNLFRDGDGCGSCFQVRCGDERLCKKEGVKLVLTDVKKSNKTKFVLSKKAFMALANDNDKQAIDLTKLKNINVQFRRVPCEYERNLSIRIEEFSKNPNHLTIKFLYQGGQTDIMAVEVAQVGSSVWQYMSQKKGPIWTTHRAPRGALRFRLVITGGFDGKWVWTENEILPIDWKIGEIYDTKIQIKDIAQESCCPSFSNREKLR